MDLSTTELVANFLSIGHLLPRPNTTTPPTISPLSTIKVPLRLRLAWTFDGRQSGEKIALTQKSEHTRRFIFEEHVLVDTTIQKRISTS